MMTIISFSTALVYCIRALSCVPFWTNNYVGQIELYTHHPFLPTLVRHLQRMGLRTCATYLIESQFMEDKYKFFGLVPSLYDLRLDFNIFRHSGVLSAMSAMVNLEVPWVNIMSKMDLVTSSADDPASGRNGIRTRKDISRCAFGKVVKMGVVTERIPQISRARSHAACFRPWKP